MLTPWPESDVSRCLASFLSNKLSEIGQSWWVSKFKLADSRKRLFCKQLSHKCTSTYAETANAGFEYGAILNYSNDQALEKDQKSNFADEIWQVLEIVKFFKNFKNAVCSVIKPNKWNLIINLAKS